MDLFKKGNIIKWWSGKGFLLSVEKLTHISNRYVSIEYIESTNRQTQNFRSSLNSNSNNYYKDWNQEIILSTTKYYSPYTNIFIEEDDIE